MSEHLTAATEELYAAWQEILTPADSRILRILDDLIHHLEAQESFREGQHRHRMPSFGWITGLAESLPETPPSGATSSESNNASQAETTPSIPGTDTGEPISSTSELGLPLAVPAFHPAHLPQSRTTAPTSSTRDAEASPGPSVSIDEIDIGQGKEGWYVDKQGDGWRVFNSYTGTGLGPLTNKASAQNLRAFCQVHAPGKFAPKTGELLWFNAGRAYEAEQRGDKGLPWEELKAEMGLES